jgi:Uma2 family endonuclease
MARRMYMIKIHAESLGNRSSLFESQPPYQENNFEVLNGEPLVLTPPAIRHQRAVLKTASMLLRKLENRGLGTILCAPCHVMLSPWDIVQPDILFIRKERTGIIGEQIVLGSPDLVIEILAGKTKASEKREKRKIYSESGVAEYWVVDPEGESVEVLIWSEIGYISTGTFVKGSTLNSLALPDLELPVSTLFSFESSCH